MAVPPDDEPASTVTGSPSFILTSVYFWDSLGSSDLSANLPTLFEDQNGGDLELLAEHVERGKEQPLSSDEEVEFVDAEDDIELIQMMAGLGLPSTFGASTKALKVKSTASKSAGLENTKVLGNSEESSLKIPLEIATQEYSTLVSETSSLTGLDSTSIAEIEPGGNLYKPMWEPVWDPHYQMYYYCNTRTWETTWNVPEGLEDYNAYKDHETGDGNTHGEPEKTNVNVEGLVGEHTPHEEGEEEEHDGVVCKFMDGGSHLRIHSDEAIVPAVSPRQTLDEQAGNSFSERVYKPVELTRSSEVGGVETPSGRGVVDSIRDNGSAAQGLAYEEENLDNSCELNNFQVGKNKLLGVMQLDSAPPDEISGSGLPQACGTHIRFTDTDDDSGDGERRVSSKSEAFLERLETELDSTTVLALQSECAAEISDELEDEDATNTTLEARKRKRTLSRIVERMPIEAWSGLMGIIEPAVLEEMSIRTAKYWYQRYRLFTRYDEGIKMDEEGWYSVTPETIAQHQAKQISTGGLTIDAFAGVGGNAIQFALRGDHVIALDIDPVKIECARHNATIYGVADYIEFIVGDFLKIAPSLKADAVFLSPPWGGPSYTNVDKYDLHSMLQPSDGFKLFQTAQAIAPRVIFFLPRNVDLDQLAELSWLASPPLPCKVERNYLNNKLKAITAYYGDMAQQKSS